MFLYRLASHLGILDVDMMSKQLTVKQLSEWSAYLSIWPSGEDAMDKRFEVLRWTMLDLAMKIHGKKGSKAPPLEKLRIFDREGKRSGGHWKTQEQVSRDMKMMAQAMGATTK